MQEVYGVQAVSLATAEKPDLILMDLSLPIMNGWDATRKIKANPETQHIPIIALTAHAMSGDRQQALDAGCDDYDTKPIELPRLLGKIKAQLERVAAPLSEEVMVKIEADGQRKQPNQVLTKTLPQQSSEIVPTQLTKRPLARILLVEDNEVNQDMLSRRLKNKGYEILLAVDGAQAVSLAKAEKPDLILMDLSLPIMNGWDATEKIKNKPETQHIPIIALTAFSMICDREQAIDAGCDDYDTKPVDLPRLLAKITAQLERVATLPSEKVMAKIEADEDKTEHNLPLTESLPEQPIKVSQGHLKSSELFSEVKPQQETKLLELEQAIKLVYSSSDNNFWRTGNLVRLSRERAEIISIRKNTIPLESKIKLRFWDDNSLDISSELGTTIDGVVSEISQEDNRRFIVQFVTEYPQLETMLPNFSSLAVRKQMKVVLNVSKLWPENLTIAKAAEDLNINPQFLTTIKKGTEKGNWATLVKLARYFSEIYQRNISLEELLLIDEVH